MFWRRERHAADFLRALPLQPVGLMWTDTSFDEARRLVQAAMRPLGSDYAAALTKAFDDRWIDAQFTSKRFGKLYLGKGSTASDGTSEMDLSGTSVVGYASVEDMAGGILFYNDDTDALSTATVGSVFNDFDGSRAARELGFSYTPVRQALAEAVAWYRERWGGEG